MVGSYPEATMKQGRAKKTIQKEEEGRMMEDIRYDAGRGRGREEVRKRNIDRQRRAKGAKVRRLD